MPEKAQDGPQQSAHHEIRLAGLQPATEYAYRLELFGAPLTETYAFRTLPLAPDAPLTFAVFGDTRDGHDVHRRIIEQIASHHPLFALHTGDLVGFGGRDSEWDTFFDIEAPLMVNAPLYPSPGNHEENDARYFDAFALPGNERWYAFDAGSARFVELQLDGRTDYQEGSEQYAWLETTLAANTQPWLVVFFHYPPYSDLNEKGPEILARRVLTPLFERYGVDIVFNGHHHDYQRREVNGVQYVVTGGGGAPIYPVTNAAGELAAFFNGPHFVLVTLQGGQFNAQAITDTGEVIDTFTLTQE
jgi:predicted phosphohydrolase